MALAALSEAPRQLAAQAIFVLRLSDLREDTRAGDRLLFRIRLDPAPANLVPLVIYRFGNRWDGSAWIAQRVGENVWDPRVLHSGVSWEAAGVRIYLIAR
jgi:hypothetical protein